MAPREKRFKRAAWPALVAFGLLAAAALAGPGRGDRIGVAGPDPGQNVTRPQTSGPIAERLARARNEAAANRWDKGFWFGFGIRRLMGEHSSMGWYPWGGPDRQLTLDDLINGRKTPLEKKVDGDQAVRGTAASLPAEARAFAAGPGRGDVPERLAWKEIGFIFRFDAKGAGLPADIRVSNLDLPFDLEGLPFVWAGMAETAESLAYLLPLYGQAAAEADRKSLLWAIGLHREPATVVPFVERILAGKESEEIRAEAASCLGEQDDAKALDLLLRTIKTDPSEDVREAAVGGLVDMNIPAAGDALVSLAFSGPDPRVRREAVHGLADKATDAAVKALLMICRGDKDPEIQQAAIHALADLPARSGLPYLIDLVRTHADTEVRKEAVEAVGDVGGPEAVKVLTEWARGRRR
jgi:hypothetical protein